MESRIKFLGHPVHPMLVPFPLGLLPAAVVFDIVFFSSNNWMWATLSFWLIAGGIVTGALAAVFGWIDWFAIPAKTRAKRIGLYHGLGNAVVLALFAVSWILRYQNLELPSTAAFILALVAVSLALVTGWLGGELVDRLGIGVDEGAHPDMPSSLSDRRGGHAGTIVHPSPHPVHR